MIIQYLDMNSFAHEAFIWLDSHFLNIVYKRSSLE